MHVVVGFCFMICEICSNMLFEDDLLDVSVVTGFENIVDLICDVGEDTERIRCKIYILMTCL